MKTIPTFSLIILFSIGACTMDVSQDASSDVTESFIETKYSYMETSEGEPLARMMISGMSCEQMCGSRIKAAVASLPGVSGTDLAFHAESDIDTLTVHFDPKLVNEKDMVQAISNIQGGTYQVREVQLSKEAKTSYYMDSEDGKQRSRNATPKASASKLSIPNIFDALKRVSSL